MENSDDRLKEIENREKKLRNKTILITIAVPILTIIISFLTSVITIQSELDIDKLNYTQEQVNKILENNDIVETRRILKFLIDGGLIGDKSNKSNLLEALDKNLDNEFESVSRYIDGVIYFDKAYYSQVRDTTIHYYEKAIEEFRWSCDLNPENTEALSYLGSSYFNLGIQLNLGSFYEMAVKEYNKALEVDPSLVNVRMDKTEALNSLGRYEEICMELNKIEEKDTVYLQESNLATYKSFREWCSSNY